MPIQVQNFNDMLVIKDHGGVNMSRLALAAVLVGALLICHGEAQTLCNMSREGFAACRPAATASNPSNPSDACCDALSKADLQCLCSYKNSSLLPYMGVDPELAMGLPAKCGVTTPDNC